MATNSISHVVDNNKLPEPIALTNSLPTKQNIFASPQSVLSPPHSDVFQTTSPQLNAETSLSISSNASQQVCNDIDLLFSLRIEFSRNLLIGFLNINSLRNEIIDLRMIAERCLPDILLV